MNKAIALLVALHAAATPIAGQLLGDWELLHSGTGYDYLVTARGSGLVDSEQDSLRVLRVAASRMLVRHIAEARAVIIGNRRAAGLATAGYDRFASSTYLLDVRSCEAEPVVAIVEVSDYDDSGDVLSRSRPERRWASVIADWDDVATRRLKEWACARLALGRSRLQSPERDRRIRSDSVRHRIPGGL